MNRIIRWLFSFRATVVLLSLLMLMLASATFLEKFCGTSVAREFVYHSPLLYALFFILVTNFFLYQASGLSDDTLLFYPDTFGGIDYAFLLCGRLYAFA